MQLVTDSNPSSFVSNHTNKIKPLEKESSLTYWAAATTGESQQYDKLSKLNLQIRKIHSNPQKFAYLKAVRKQGQFSDPLVARQIDRLYYGFLGNQIDADLMKQIVELSSDIEQKFSTHRGMVDGEELTLNQITQILKTSTNNIERKKAWSAAKQVGPVVADDVIRLVKLRNRAARTVGFENFHVMRLATGEQDVKVLDKLFAELDSQTAQPFAKIKAGLDRTLSKMYNVGIAQIRPWHYHDQFFQEVPMVQEVNLDTFYKGKNIEQLSAVFYNGIGMDVTDILENSDLYDRKGKNPHGFCTDIDKEGDVRILCNIKDVEYWMTVQLHELGHAVYFKYHDPEVPYLLRGPAHAFTTEAIAMMFGRLSKNALWMQQMLGLTDEQREQIKEVTEYQQRLGQLIFARWALVMYNFERKLYADPDQDLNKLWWDLVEKYQFVSRPKFRDQPDWAAKIHIANSPAYYHNYILGEMLASQIQHDMIKKIPEMTTDKGYSYVGCTQIAEYLKTNIFAPGNVYQYNEMIERATGEKLTPKYFVEDFVK